jgi:hypothetical protein
MTLEQSFIETARAIGFTIGLFVIVISVFLSIGVMIYSKKWYIKLGGAIAFYVILSVIVYIMNLPLNFIFFKFFFK